MSEHIRAAGLYRSLGERDPETAAIAASVFGAERAFIGALGIIGLRSRMQGSLTEELTRTLVEGAGALMRERERRYSGLSCGGAYASDEDRLAG